MFKNNYKDSIEYKKSMYKKLAISAQKPGETTDEYIARRKAMKGLMAKEEMEAETNPLRKKRMQYLYDQGVFDFSDI